MHDRTNAWGTLILLTGALSVGLTGCTGTSTDEAPSSSPTAARRPAADAFPTPVPLVHGRVLARQRANGEWYVWIAAPDPVRGYREAQRLLTGAGYVITKDRQGAGGADGQLCTERLCVTLTGVDDPRYGDSVAYEVFRPSGLS